MDFSTPTSWVQWPTFLTNGCNVFWLTDIGVFVLGLLMGSFANVLIVRLPQEQDVVFSRSRCVSCKNKIAWFDNIPVLSWCWLRAKCRACGARISWRYPVVELLCAALFLAVHIKYGYEWVQLEYTLFVWALVIGSFIDFDHMILPNELTLTGIVIGLLGAALNPERSFWASFTGVLFGGGILWLIAWLYYVFRKQEGMGGGDIKLLAWIGAVLGWLSIPFVIVVASLTGTFVGVLVGLKRGEGLKAAIPFGPYLALGALLYLFVEPWLSHMYWRALIPSVTW